MKKFSFYVPGIFPGRNEAEKAARGNKFAAAQLKETWTERVSIHILHKAGNKPPKFGKVFIQLLWVEKDRRRDPDNFSSAKKYVFDGMIRAKIIPNDGWDQIEGFEDKWIVDKQKPGVFVIVTGE